MQVLSLTRIARRRRAVAAASLLLLGAAPQAQAQSEVNGVQHFFECFGLMIGDPNEHAVECLPNNVKIDVFPDSSDDSGPFAILPAPPPPVPVAPTPVVTDCGPTDCGPTDCGPTDCGPTDCGPSDCGAPV